MITRVSMTRWARVACLASLAAALVGCSDDGDGGNGGNGGDGGGGESADAYYIGTASAALGAASNEADCATCHSADGSQDGYPGETLADIAYLTSYKGGDAPTLLDATNACVTGWMGGEALTETDPEWASLLAYLQSISDESVTEPRALMPEVLADEAAYEAAYAGTGDASAGEAKYMDACASCHDTGLTVGAFPTPGLTALSTFSAGRIAQQVRTSGPPPSGMQDSADSTPGPMPFFEPADLSKQDLADIIAYIKG